MTPCRKSAVLLALAALWLGAGCGGGDRTPFAAETDESDYRQGQQLKTQGRYSEALSSFLHVIEKRGERESAESHLEAGLIYLNHIKDPIEAIHQFKKYLELQPNSKQAPYVLGQVNVAKREFARTLPAHPLEDQSIRFEMQDQVERLQRENEELKAELQSRGIAPLPSIRTSRGTAAFAPAERSPITLAPLPAGVDSDALPAVAPAAPKALFNLSQTAARPIPSAPAVGRKHTIAPGDTLYRIAVKYYGSGAKVEEIFNANRDVMRDKNTLPRVGTELKIP